MTPVAGQTVVVAGGGIGGVATANRRWHWHWGKVTFEQRVMRRWL